MKFFTAPNFYFHFFFLLISLIYKWIETICRNVVLEYTILRLRCCLLCNTALANLAQCFGEILMLQLKIFIQKKKNPNRTKHNRLCYTDQELSLLLVSNHYCIIRLSGEIVSLFNEYMMYVTQRNVTISNLLTRVDNSV